MNARPQMLVLVALVCLGVMPLAWGDDEPKKPKPQTGVQTDGARSQGSRPQAPPPIRPPSIDHGGSRTSKTWITTPQGTRVAVGKGLSFRGVKVYLSLLWDVVGVDEKTGKTLYATNVGAFWNAFGFKEITVSGTKTWAVELRPGARARAGKDKRQFHDLRTGAKLVPDGQTKPDLGAALKPSVVYHGAMSRVAQPVHFLVSTQANWDLLRMRMFGPKPKQAFAAIDFDKNMLVLTSSGDGWNCDGISIEAAFENTDRVLIRTRRHTFQTSGGGKQTRPYGVFVLPRRPGKTVVLERKVNSRAFRLRRLRPIWAGVGRLPWRGRGAPPAGHDQTRDAQKRQYHHDPRRTVALEVRDGPRTIVVLHGPAHARHVERTDGIRRVVMIGASVVHAV